MGRQGQLKGMETATGDEELDARSVLIDAMKKKKLTVYENRRVDPPLLVTLVASEKVKVQAIDELAEGDDDESEDGEGVTVAEGEQKASKKRAPAEA